ncbi:MAG: hypothetical protein QGF74_01580 [Candidatus Nanoarchaeia archaeon]|jgi:hypothetical protein|nr:hypothetical protein [Candidatus Nanoarchaeia archaeon]|tara:strand:+ start:568 stop:960 length:393 start_codon:yes stop_codon:yes gene_type:complete
MIEEHFEDEVYTEVKLLDTSSGSNPEHITSNKLHYSLRSTLVGQETEIHQVYKKPREKGIIYKFLSPNYGEIIVGLTLSRSDWFLSVATKSESLSKILMEDITFKCEYIAEEPSFFQRERLKGLLEQIFE